MNFQPSEESAREKMKRSGAFFASDEVRVLFDLLDVYRSALNRIAERVDVDSNGEYIVRGQPALSGFQANNLARVALAANVQASPE